MTNELTEALETLWCETHNCIVRAESLGCERAVGVAILRGEVADPTNCQYLAVAERRQG